MPFVYDDEILLNDPSNDIIGTRTYVKLLKKIITEKKDSTPLTIGLFGGWGVGKSSIVKTLIHELIDDKVKIVKYDAWKYSNDAFRRNFLLQMIEQLKITPKSSLENLFYKEKSEDVNHKIAIKKSSILSLLIYIPFIYISIKYCFPIGFNLDSLIFATLTLLNAFALKDLLIDYKINIKESKIFSPEQFENIFSEIVLTATQTGNSPLKWIEKFIGTNENNKLVIIIDNVDRCNKETSKELLLTVKNFLEKENCVFIIPVDDEAIRKSLDYEDEEREEFLRKLFNISIRIKKMSNKDLFNFTLKIIEANNFYYSENIANIISQEFSKNPRRIKQFLNNLYFEQINAEFQEQNGLIKSGVITNNLEFLSKILIIKEEWPELYKLLDDDKNLIGKINNDIIHNNYNFEDGKWKSEKGVVLSNEQFIFFRRTRTIIVDNIEPFLRLSYPSNETLENVKNIIINTDFEDLLKVLTEKLINIDYLWNIISDMLDEAIHKRHTFETDGFNIINMIIKIINIEEYTLEFDKIYIKFESFIDNEKTASLIDKFDTDSLLNYANKLYLKKKDYLVNYISIYINDTISNTKDNKFNSSYVNIVKKYVIIFYESDILLKKVTNAFSQLFHSMSICQNINDDFFDLTCKKASRLFSNQSVDVIVDKINESYSNNDIIKYMKIIKSMKEQNFMSETQVNKYINKIIPYIHTTNEFNAMKFWLDSMVGFIQKGMKIIEINNLLQVIRTKQQYAFTSYFNNNRTPLILECNKTLIILLKDIYIYTNFGNQDIMNIISSYYSRNDCLELIISSLEAVDNIIINSEMLKWSFADGIINVFISTSDLNILTKSIETITLMLDKTYSKEEKLYGLNNQQIKQITNRLFNAMVSKDKGLSDHAKKWIFNIKNKALIAPFIIELIKNSKVINDYSLIIDVVKHLEDETIIDAIIYTIITKSEYNILLESIKAIEITFPNYIKYITNSLDEIILKNDVFREYDNGRIVISTCVEKFYLLSEDGKAIIVENINKILDSEQEEKILFALNELNKIISIMSQKLKDLSIAIVEKIRSKKIYLNNEIINDLLKKTYSRLKG